jgi:hypothetical protein
MIARVGADQEWFAAGGSVKTQDGIGSDGQKTFKSHAGIDALLRSGCWTLSGEAIYDEYGLKQPLDPNAVTWGRSLYYRDQNAAPGQPLHGVGYYVDLTYRGQKWSAMFNYGEFHPHAIGDPRHDRINRRSIAKVIRHATAHLDLYAMLLVESDPPAWFDGRTSRAWEVLCGLQYAL